MLLIQLILILGFSVWGAILIPAKESPSNVKGRIIGGQDAFAGGFPFAAAITVETPTSRHFCGGSLIEPEWILTSAQCVDRATTLTIRLGNTDLNGVDANTIVVETGNYTIHPDYNSETLEADIALIKLRMAVKLSAYVQMIFTPYKEILDGAIVTAIGWGQTNDADPEFSSHLQSVELSVISNQECELTYGNQIKDGMICSSGNYNEGTCTGDSGGALIEHTGLPGLLDAWIVGVASFYSGNGCETTDPSGFTRTYFYMDWIKNVTNIGGVVPI